MSASDIQAVAARRATIRQKLVGLDVAQAEFEAELDELAVAERAMQRLARLMPDYEEGAPSFPTEYVDAEPVHRRAVGVLKSLLAGRG
jgi:hypothetical protein